MKIANGRYEVGILRTASWEILQFLRNAFGSLVRVEFLTIAIPSLAILEILPRLGILPRSLIPTPWDVVETLGQMVLRQRLLDHYLLSLGKFLLGLGLAVLTAVPIGILMGWNLFIRRHALPVFQLLSPVPPPAWVPITIIFFGIGLPMQVFLIFLGAFYPILFNTYQGVKDTDPRYLASARVFGASELTLILKVYFWHALGSIIMSIKTGVVMALVMLTIAEMYGGRSGIGYLLTEAKDFFRIPPMVVCMAILGFTGWFSIEILKYVEIKLAVWKLGR